MIALGFENGMIELYKFYNNREKDMLIPIENNNKIPENYAHSNTIRRLKFRKL